MNTIKNMNRESYRAALEDIKVVNEMGLDVKFQGIIKKYDLHNATKAALIPNLAGVDLDEKFEELYNVQEAFLQSAIEKGKQRYIANRRHMRELEKENAELRAQLASKKE